MNFHALKFATWLIAILVVTALYELASDGESLLASSFGAGVLLVGFVFRRLIFRSVHRVVEGTLTSQAQKIFGVADTADETVGANAPFDPDAALERYMARRQAGEAMPPSPELEAARPTFGRKGL